jgi:hypothetical protein
MGGNVGRTATGIAGKCAVQISAITHVPVTRQEAMPIKNWYHNEIARKLFGIEFDKNPPRNLDTIELITMDAGRHS